MKRIVIIGYGNPLRQDEGIGRIAAEAVADTVRDPRVTVIPCRQLEPGLLESIAEADCVLFIHAVERGIPGVMSLTRVRPDAFPSPPPFHRMKPSSLLASCRVLRGRSPEAVALTVSGEHFSPGDVLSPSVAEMLPLLVDRVQAMIRSECGAQDIEEYVEAVPPGESVYPGGSSAAPEPTGESIQPQPPDVAE